MTEAASKPVSARVSERMASVTDQGVHGGVNGAVQGPVDAPVTESPTESVSENVRALAVAAKEAARGVAAASDAQRNEALEAIAQALENAKDAILGANAADVSEAQPEAARTRTRSARGLATRRTGARAGRPFETFACETRCDDRGRACGGAFTRSHWPGARTHNARHRA